MKKLTLLAFICWLSALLLLIYILFPFWQHANLWLLSFALILSLLGLVAWYLLWVAAKHSNHWQKLAYKDELTGLLNRRGLLATKLNMPYCLIILDINNFKRINDTHGHPVGDQVLIHLAHTLQQLSRKSDYCSRWGGDEFIVVLTQANQYMGNAFVERLKQSLLIEKQSLPLFSITAGWVDSHPTAPLQAIIQQADELLLQQKSLISSYYK